MTRKVAAMRSHSCWEWGHGAPKGCSWVGILGPGLSPQLCRGDLVGSETSGWGALTLRWLGPCSEACLGGLLQRGGHPVPGLVQSPSWCVRGAHAPPAASQGNVSTFLLRHQTITWRPASSARRMFTFSFFHSQNVY